MNHVHLSQLDLNLLRIFDAIAEERSATRAGARLGLSQSAISHALGRLRQLFGDPLFTRGPDGMRPTARAAEIAPALRDAMTALQLAIAPVSFSPLQTDRRFTIAAGAYFASVLLPTVVARLRAEAPLSEVRIRAPDSDLEEALRNGAVDIAVGVFADLSDRLDREVIFEEQGVWAIRADHPAANAPLTLETLARLSHVVLAVTPNSDESGGLGWGRGRRVNVLSGSGGVDEVLSHAGLRRTIAVRVHDIYGALSIVSRTDMMTLAPRRLAEVHARALGLKLLDPPYPARGLTGETIWSGEAGGHPAVAWLRQLVREAAAQM